jgi:hypothetical protein
MGVAYFDGSGVTLFVELAFVNGSGFAVWDEDLWDSGTWGPDLTWTDVSEYVRYAPPITINRGFNRRLQSWEAGRAQFTLENTDGRFSPENLSGPYVSAGVTEIRPWRPVRIYATYGGTTYHLFRGYILSWQEEWTLNKPGEGDAIVTVSAVDEIASLSRYDGFEQTADGAGETTGARIHRVLDNAAHAGERAIDVGLFTTQATTLAQNAVAELKLTADSEGGYLWIDADGTVTFGDNETLVASTRSNTSQATYGDSSGLPYRNVSTAYDGDQIANIVSFARAGGSEQTVSDSDSRALYGDKRYSRNDLICESDSEVLALAARFLFLNQDTELRVESLDVLPRAQPSTLYAEVLGRKPLDRLTILRNPPGGHTINRDAYISSISHTIGTAWFTRFGLSDAVYPSGDELGIWDTSEWDEAFWDAST